MAFQPETKKHVSHGPHASQPKANDYLAAAVNSNQPSMNGEEEKIQTHGEDKPADQSNEYFQDMEEKVRNWQRRPADNTHMIQDYEISQSKIDISHFIPEADEIIQPTKRA